MVYSVTSAVGPVSSRDFVSLRQVSMRNGYFISASAATTYSDMPPQAGKVRLGKRWEGRGGWEGKVGGEGRGRWEGRG